MKIEYSEIKIGIIGLGYVGLPLAVEFGKKFSVVGFDTNESRINDLKEGVDRTLECSVEEMFLARFLKFSGNVDDLNSCNIYIVTVPTPIDEHKNPSLTALISASNIIGQVISKSNIVIYESTVYPGATEEVCIPVIEKRSGKAFNVDFFVGYSPERINPGDKRHRLTSIKKVTSGSTPDTAKFVDDLYSSIIEAGTYLASSIRVAEAAKVIENTQRDVNIALVNELSIIFSILGIDTSEVLEAAGTKWNFMPFRPGLVGGHCIGVDPYYLTHKAQSVGYHPEIILAGRRINDGMGKIVVSTLIKNMIKKNINLCDSRVLLMGFTFKEDCPDIRNTRVIDIYTGLADYGLDVDVYDPWADPVEIEDAFGFSLLDRLEYGEKYDAVVFAVAHSQFKSFTSTDIDAYCKKRRVVFDLKNILESGVDIRL